MSGAIIGGLLGGAFNLLAGNQTNKANAIQAENQANYQAAAADKSEDFQRWAIKNQEDYQTGSNAKQMAFQDKANIEKRDFDRMMAEMSMGYEDWQSNKANAFTDYSNDKQMAFQKQAAADQMAFQDRSAETAMKYGTMMSSTAYQRAMQDMRAAGLNPMLAYQQGGASSFQGSSQSGSAPSGASGAGKGGSGTSASAGLPSGASSAGAGGSRPFTPGAKAVMQNAMGPAIATALQGSKISTELEAMDAGIANTRANTLNTSAQVNRTQAETALTTQQVESEPVRRDLMRAQGRLNQAQTATEYHRPGLIQQQTNSGSAQEHLDRLEIQRFQNWGPRSPAADAGANIEAAGPRTIQGIQELIGRLRDALR